MSLKNSSQLNFPLVSIVTPSYNQASFLERTIKSVLFQDYPNIEYIVIDGASTDGSKAIIEKYAAKLSYWVSEPDSGQTDAINKGFGMAKGDILAWLNSDDVLHQGAVSQAVTYLVNNPEVGLVYGDANFINAQDQAIGKFPAAQTNLKKLRRGFVHVPQQATFFRANLWKKVGPLDPTFYFAMDYDLWVRLAKITKFSYVPKLWASFRLHGDTKTISEDDRCWPEMIRVHYRDGGKNISFITLKYHIRKLAAPFLVWKRKKMINRS